MRSRGLALVGIVVLIVAFGILFFTALHSVTTSQDRGEKALAALKELAAGADCARTVNAEIDQLRDDDLAEFLEAIVVRDITRIRDATHELRNEPRRDVWVKLRCVKGQATPRPAPTTTTTTRKER